MGYTILNTEDRDPERGLIQYDLEITFEDGSILETSVLNSVSGPEAEQGKIVPPNKIKAFLDNYVNSIKK